MVVFTATLLLCSAVKNLPAIQEMWARSLDHEDPLEKRMATHSTVRILDNSHGQRSLVGHNPWDCKKSDMTEATEHAHIHSFYLPNTQFLKKNIYWSQIIMHKTYFSKFPALGHIKKRSTTEWWKWKISHPLHELYPFLANI